MVSKIFHDKIYGKCFSKASGYGKIDKTLRTLVSKGFQSITFTDLSITPEQLEYCVDNFEEIRFFDHHPATEETYEIYKDHDKVKECVFRDDFSGAGIMFLEMINKAIPTNPKLAKLAMLGDIYDLWKTDHNDWVEAFRLNDLFWIMGFYNFEERFKDGYDGLTPTENGYIDDHHQEVEKILDVAAIEEINNTGAKDDQIKGALIIMPNDKKVISHVTFMIPDYYFYYIITYDTFNNQYVMSVRTANVDNLPVKPNINKILQELTLSNDAVVTAGGHELAGGVTFTSDTKIPEILEIIKTEIQSRFDIADNVAF